jgi:addiction module HigA family antidote
LIWGVDADGHLKPNTPNGRVDMKPDAKTTIGVRHRLPTHRPPTHPGEMLLQEFLKALGITQIDAASRLGISFRRMNTLVKGRRGVTADSRARHCAA